MNQQHDDGPSVGIISLGCPKNLVDSEQLMARLAEAGCLMCEDLEDAQILIVNTCGFIQEAKEESLDMILRCAGDKGHGALEKLVVTGCLAQRYRDELTEELGEVDAVIGLDSTDEIVEFCTGSAAAGRTCDVPPRLRLTAGHFAYLRVAEGCDNRCAYCAIPDIRGPFRSTAIEPLVEEAQQLADDGARELCLIAQDTTRYGTDIYGRLRLHELLARVADIDSVQWVRLLYTHPAHFYPELIDALASTPKVVPYVDLPLQHVSDKILSSMRRRVTQAQIRSLIADLRERIRECFIRTAFIVGFPGEGDEEFEELRRFVEETRFERLGVFTYSEEEGTPAAEFADQVPEDLREERLDTIMTLQQSLAFDFNESLVGKKLPCVIDAPGEEDGLWVGRTYGDAPDVDGCIYVRDPDLSPGDFVTLRVTGTQDYDLVGETVG